MTSKSESIKTPLARARGWGSAKDGTGRWITMRVTSVANVFLVAWFVWSLHAIVGASYEELTVWLARPLNAILMILFTISVFWHACLGCREIVEDYFHIEWMKITKLVGIYLFFFALTVACIFSILKIAL